MKIKNYWLATSLIILSASTSTHAAGARFCDAYARTGVAQHISNLAHGCNQTGLRWSANFIGQKAWCRTVRRVIAEGETRARRAALTACGVPANIRKPWNTISNRHQNDIIAAAVGRMPADDVRSLRIFNREGVDLRHEWDGNYGTVLFHAIDNQAEKSVRYLIKIDKYQEGLAKSYSHSFLSSRLLKKTTTKDKSLAVGELVNRLKTTAMTFRFPSRGKP